MSQSIENNIKSGPFFTDRDQMLSLLVELSLKMLSAAKEQDWEIVSEYESQRSTVMKLIFTPPPGPQEAQAIAVCIRKILDIDQDIITQGRESREEYERELMNLKQGRQAVRAYR